MFNAPGIRHNSSSTSTTRATDLCSRRLNNGCGPGGGQQQLHRDHDATIAGAYLDYWNLLRRQVPNPVTERQGDGANQGDMLKTADRTPVTANLAGGATMEVWFSLNMPGHAQPPAKTVKHPPSPPPDMERLFSLMRKAHRSIFFAVFMPSQGGIHSIVSEAVDLGTKDTSLEVIGAISDTKAMWGFEASTKTASGKKLPAWSPHVFQHKGVSVVRATAITDKEIGRQLGNFKIDETLTVGKAIIHDKIIVVDPLDPVNCVVAFGSHNMGYKASYSNDENLVIVRGHQALAVAYAVHVLDVYDHYRFRAAEAELSHPKKQAGGGAAAPSKDPR